MAIAEAVIPEQVGQAHLVYGGGSEPHREGSTIFLPLYIDGFRVLATGKHFVFRDIPGGTGYHGGVDKDRVFLIEIPLDSVDHFEKAE